MRKYAQKYLRYHKGYEKRANTELRKVFKAWTDAIKWDELQAGSYSSQISNAFDITLMNNAYINIYHSIGLVHGKRIGKDINRELKETRKALADYLGVTSDKIPKIKEVI